MMLLNGPCRADDPAESVRVTAQQAPVSAPVPDPFNQLYATAGRTLGFNRAAHPRLELQALNLAASRPVNALAGYTAGTGTLL